jgi:predicted enzyme related to lactoylglutathione lyase
MAIKSVGSVAVVVKNGTRAKKWYKEKLGFVVNSEDGHWITVAPPKSRGFEIHLCEGKHLEKGNTGILCFADNRDKTYSELSKKGVKFTQKPDDQGWGKYAQFQDIDGNGFWLVKG